MQVAVIFTCPECKQEVRLRAQDLLRARRERIGTNVLPITIMASSIQHEGCGGYLIKSAASGLVLDGRVVNVAADSGIPDIVDATFRPNPLVAYLKREYG